MTFVVRRRHADALDEFLGAQEIKLTDAVRVPGMSRSVDAIHVASAEQLGSELTALVTYDSRMAEAARKAGLPVAE
ncbi:hypothetical protein [Amycolatopsis sp.]|uniref:hypothetical protein n=1 Tax=Amycolatopsis sp. TaxID=37632 RepID=UPI002C4CCEB2|nr:hypothetical protein [Amycolatopsis sp.]HVV10086.1 hypothetical protein [Amycolatopsis sp.]